MTRRLDGVKLTPSTRRWLRYRIRSTVVKVALDQAFMAPPFLFCFLTYSALAEGADPIPRIRAQLPAL